MSTQEILRDIPADRVEQVMAEFVAIGAKVSKTRQADGRFTVVATFDRAAHLAPVAMESSDEALTDLPQSPEGPLPPIGRSTDFAAVAPEYRLYFERCEIRPERSGAVQTQVTRLLGKAPRYRALSLELGIPWFFIGIVHALEANMDFAGHMHNGDPLDARTVRVPKGRPVHGNPPFTWEESARDALGMKGFTGQSDWSVARMLHRWEAFNGFGYRSRGLASPYLWSFSTHYEKGRFVADHVFDAESVSQQCGAAVLLKALHDRSLA